MKTVLAFAAALGAALLAAGAAMAKAPAPFRDCPYCPEMVVAPAGSFDMGSTEAELAYEDLPALFAKRETPRHRVTFARPFAMSATEVTRGLYARFARETRLSTSPGCAMYDAKTDSWPVQDGFTWDHPGFAQTDDHPAVCVNWNDATAFAAWLSAKTGKRYRLPSEAEWEYAARAGTITARDWGQSTAPVCGRANIMSRGTQAALGWPASWKSKLICTDDRAFTLPVASFAPNAFGLYDMIGNSWEWVADCYHPTYAGAPADGSAWNEVDCKGRMPRGGGFHSEPNFARAATRGQSPADYRGVAASIRLVRDLP